MIMSWQHPSGEWHEFLEGDTIWYKEMHKVAAMFEGNKLPVVLELDDDKYLCTGDIYKDVRKKHPKTRTFKSIPHTETPFRRFLESL